MALSFNRLGHQSRASLNSLSSLSSLTSGKSFSSSLSPNLRCSYPHHTSFPTLTRCPHSPTPHPSPHSLSCHRHFIGSLLRRFKVLKGFTQEEEPPTLKQEVREVMTSKVVAAMDDRSEELGEALKEKLSKVISNEGAFLLYDHTLTIKSWNNQALRSVVNPKRRLQANDMLCANGALSLREEMDGMVDKIVTKLIDEEGVDESESEARLKCRVKDIRDEFWTEYFKNGDPKEKYIENMKRDIKEMDLIDDYEGDEYSGSISGEFQRLGKKKFSRGRGGGHGQPPQASGNKHPKPRF
eukprot:GHVN01051317.1.p1 GENE.GHVN01051317.1~~GHVN01051317.1.p1  ORF type:complete len:297 (-),score=82.67 GHVN01051317.1:323-1213(-)